MKLKEGINPDILLTLGFSKVDKEEPQLDDDDTLVYYDYEYLLGLGRRGQCYYLLYSVTNNAFDIYATKPDGSGSSTSVDDVFIKLVPYVSI